MKQLSVISHQLSVIPQGDGISDQFETKRAPQSPFRQLTEKDLAYAALEAAKRSKDLAGVEAARIWVARIQVEERQARLLLLEHVCDRMAADRQMSKLANGQ